MDQHTNDVNPPNSVDEKLVNKLRIVSHLLNGLGILILLIGTSYEYDELTKQVIECTNQDIYIDRFNISCHESYSQLSIVKESIIGLLWFRTTIISLFGCTITAFILMERYKDNAYKKLVIYLSIIGAALGMLIAGLLTNSLLEQLPWIMILSSLVYIIFTCIDIMESDYIKETCSKHKYKVIIGFACIICVIEWIIFATNIALVRVVENNDVLKLRQKALDIRWYGWTVSFLLMYLSVSNIHGVIYTNFKNNDNKHTALFICWSIIVIGCISFALSLNGYVFSILLPVIILIGLMWDYIAYRHWLITRIVCTNITPDENV